MVLGAIRAGTVAFLLAAFVVQAAEAQGPYQRQGSEFPYGRFGAVAPATYGQQAAATPQPYGAYQPVNYAPSPPPAAADGSGVVSLGQYPRLNAPMYPAPVQNVPAWQGGTIITNQALAPHEMLYPHSYHAMYPPYYYKVKGGWIVTPLGVRQHEQWKLQGTEVKVKYHSHYRPLSGFFPPY